MVIKPVSEILAPADLREPLLNALVPNVDNYQVLLMQPRGQIEVGAEYVRNRNRELAERQFGEFLSDALNVQADLVVSPEYSMPWNVLLNAIKSGNSPTQGKLWALGCESIKFSELEALKRELAPFAVVLHEALTQEAERFVSPLVYVFKTLAANDSEEEIIVLLIQFKTHPMGDPDHFEISGLQRGNWVYQFGGNEQNIKLASLICADALAFEDSHARSIYDRALILHIQLNQKPRHERFLGCRQRLLGFSGDATEVLCLNWARNVHLWRGDEEECWQNIAGSAWYLKSNEFDDRDLVLSKNHRRGLYYTYLKPLRSHAMFFNYDPATYLLEATKVAHVGVPGAVSRRRGPQLTKTCMWDDATGSWQEQEPADDGFHAVAEYSAEAKDAIKNIAANNPFEAERILALSAGKIGDSGEWYKIPSLDSCVIESQEIIYRLTFCQDTHPTARDFRIAQLTRLKNLWHILHTEDLPTALAELKDSFRLKWSPDFPHQNAISNDGRRATVIYMGEDSTIEQVEETKRKIAEYLRRTAGDIDKSRTARQRLAVWYRDNGNLILFDHHQ